MKLVTNPSIVKVSQSGLQQPGTALLQMKGVIHRLQPLIVCHLLDGSSICCGFVQEYLAIGGDPDFCKLTAKLAFGDDSSVLKEGRAITVQSLSGDPQGCWVPCLAVAVTLRTIGNMHRSSWLPSGHSAVPASQ